MRVGIVFVFVDYHRRGGKSRISMQPQIGPLIAGLLPPHVEIDLINETWEEPDWSRDYDLLFISCMHSDFDRARQVSHYWRTRGAKTVIGGALPSTYPELCRPYFDAVVIGEPEDTVPGLFEDFCRGRLQPLYRSAGYRAARVATPRFDLLARKALHPFGLEVTRGCPFFCDFCVVTATGSEHRVRPLERVISDIKAGQTVLERFVPRYKTRVVGFTDNNLGGSLSYLRDFCDAVRPLGIQWYAAVTFNVISNPELVKKMARAGCRVLFVGLESFNPAAITDMRKFQNATHKTRAALDLCRDHGILVMSGMMVSPVTDGVDYLRRLPDHLAESGLHVPTFLCFEAPLPGTPFFTRLADDPHPRFLPGALLRDFSGYTLVVRPRQAEVGEFVAAYREAVAQVYAGRRRWAKLVHDLPRLLTRGGWFPAVADAVDMATTKSARRPAPGRTYLAGSDTPPPETVPLTDADFSSDIERNAVLGPWAVSDTEGRALSHWRRRQPTSSILVARSMAGGTISREAASPVEKGVA